VSFKQIKDYETSLRTMIDLIRQSSEELRKN